MGRTAAHEYRHRYIKISKIVMILKAVSWGRFVTSSVAAVGVLIIWSGLRGARPRRS